MVKGEIFRMEFLVEQRKQVPQQAKTSTKPLAEKMEPGQEDGKDLEDDMDEIFAPAGK